MLVPRKNNRARCSAPPDRLQVHLCQTGKIDGVVFKDLDLGFAGRQEYLVASGDQRIEQHLAGKVIGRTNPLPFKKRPNTISAFVAMMKKLLISMI